MLFATVAGLESMIAPKTRTEIKTPVADIVQKLMNPSIRNKPKMTSIKGSRYTNGISNNPGINPSNCPAIYPAKLSRPMMKNLVAPNVRNTTPSVIRSKVYAIFLCRLLC